MISDRILILLFLIICIKNNLNWDLSNIMNFFDNWLQDINNVYDSPTPERLDELKKFLLIRDDDTIGKHIIPRYATRAFLLYKNEGLKQLINIFEDTPGTIYPKAIFASLISFSMGYFYDCGLPQTQKHLERYPTLSDDLIQYSKKSLYELLSKILVLNGDYIFLSTYITEISMGGVFSQFIDRNSHLTVQIEPKVILYELFRLISNCMISINHETIDDFKLLIEQNLREEEYQKFLERNLVLLDPLAKLIIPKQELGSDYITDFVIRKYNDEYIVVEIEKPSNKIFNENNDFNAQLFHALKQVLDFQEWVESNISYAQRHMPNISSPKGLVIIGRTNELSEERLNDLRRLNMTLNDRVNILSYDDLIHKASLYYDYLFSK